MMRTNDSSMSSGLVVNEIVSISISRSLMASGPKNCASTLNRMLFWPGDVDRVAGRISLFPVGAEHLFPAGDHLHPMADLGLRGPSDVLLQERSLFLGKFRHAFRCNRVVLQTFVHERNVVLQNRTTVRLPIVP